MSGSVPKCSGVNRAGEPCGSPVVDSDGWCFSHAPDREAERAEARKRGGRGSSNLNRARRLLPLYGVLEKALDEVHDGSLTPAVAQAMAALGRCLVVVVSAGELEERLRSLEEALQ